MSKKFKVWATTRVHVVKVVEAETAAEAIEKLDGSVETTDDNRVKVCDESGLIDVEIDDEYVLCDESDAVEVS